ncbi:MAG TPA: hypothetical protein DCP03_16305 [Polaromonas sp.]|uniref:hypothetical protein n=1 Tax=Polaromonas sp. UBA4122 TaxID=1947074 RepID=UPI000EEFF700|nr:hypothetical protein [Polaromonas sp. UBA4122]HAL39579.1 hypothetical protein [Polaromonas sp.]
MSNFVFPPARLVIPMVVALLVASGCGGGGGVDVAGVGSGGTGAISGTATAGPISNATITAYSINGGQMGAQIATAATDVNGNFTMAIGSYAGPVMLQASGGSYTDEATGTVMPMAAADAMTAVMPTVAAGATNSGIQVTPVTAMAQAMAQHMNGGMTDANIAAANTAMGNNFSVSDILHIRPMNPLVAGSGTGVSQDAQNYGMTLAAMSQYAKTLGLTTSSTMVTAMMNDATDGILDGKAGATSVQMGGMAGGMLPATAGTSGMGAAMNAFMNSTQNKSGVTTVTLMNKLNGSSGQISSSVPAMMNATVGGTVFNGPVSKATVMAFAVNSGTVGAQIASVATDGQGNFTLPLGSYSGPVMLQTIGAGYTDEATSTTMTMATNEFMSAALPTVASGANVTGVRITPLTSMAQTRALTLSGGMTDVNIAAANTAMGNYFSVSDIVHTQPINPTVAGTGVGASVDARNYGMALAAMSQYAKTLNMTLSSTLVTAMMNDASDGVMDGKNGVNQISMSMGGMKGTSMMAPSAGTSSLSSAMTSFMNSVANASGLTVTDMAGLMQKLNSSNGTI